MEEGKTFVKLPALTLGKPTANNRVYTEEVMRRALTSLRSYVPVRLSRSSVEQPLVDAQDLYHATMVGEATNLVVEGDQLLVDIKLYGKELIEQLEDGKLAVRPLGVGSLNGTVVMDDYEIDGFVLTDKPA